MNQDSNQLKGEELDVKANSLFSRNHIIVMSDEEMGTLQMLKEKWQRYGRLALIKELEAEGPKDIDESSTKNSREAKIALYVNKTNGLWRTLLARKHKELE